MRIPIFTICVYILSFSAAGQPAMSSDSILQSTETTDSLRISTLIKMAYDHSRTDLKKAFKYIEEADSVLLATGYSQMQPYIDYNKSMLYRNQGDFEQSLFYLQGFMEVMNERRDSQELIKGLNVEMTVYYELKDYERTLETALKMKKISESQQNVRGQISALSFMALTMSDRDFTDEAIAHYQDAIQLCELVKDSARLANIYNNLAGAYLKKKGLYKRYKIL